MKGETCFCGRQKKPNRAYSAKYSKIVLLCATCDKKLVGIIKEKCGADTGLTARVVDAYIMMWKNKRQPGVLCEQ